MKKSRNYYSPKLIPDIPVRIRRRPGYLKKLYFKYNEKIKNINEDFIKLKYNKGIDKYFDKAPLPEKYYENEVVLIPKNISTLFAYWEIREDTFEHLKSNFNVFDNATLQLYKNAKLYRKIENLSRFGSYYILNIDANSEYKVTIGFENQYGHFFEIASSNYAISPSGKISNKIATIWGLPNYSNGKIKITKYSKTNLPNNEKFKNEILNSNSYELYSLYENLKIINLCSSNSYIDSYKK